jgi:signal transduction histidine kinase/DNA-binding response OmpR family regulator
VLQLILDSLADGVAVADEAGTLVAINRTGRDILKSDAPHLAPTEWARHYGVFLPDQATPYPTDRFPLSRAVRGELVDDDEQFVRRPDLPEGLWLSVTARPVVEEDGTRRGAVAVFRDVTAQKRMATALHETEAHLRRLKDEADASNRAKSEFLAAMSHELRTPLNSIIGFSELLADEKFGSLNERQSRYVANVLESGRHLLNLINDILDLAKVEAGRVELVKDTFDLAAAVASVVAIVSPMAAQKGLALHVAHQPGIGPIHADEAKLKQILFNLLTNAIKFTPAGGAVTVGASVVGSASGPAGDGELHIRVSDTGIGIKPEHHELVFERFRQIDSSYARAQQGTGLGLTLCRQLADLHGGSLRLESEGIRGKGSTFILALPIANLSDQAGITQPAQYAAETEVEREGVERPPLILVVEDDDAAYELLADSLSGYLLSRAPDGADAIRAARELRPDLIVLDLGLPKVNGLDVLTILKSHSDTDDIPVVIVSVSDKRALPLGIEVADWLVKPVRRERVACVVERVLAAHSREHRTLLLVDDDPSSLQAARDLLESEGYGIMSATSGHDALRLASRRRPDMILLDLVMPGMDGFAVADQLKSDSTTRDVPIVVVTGKSLTTDDRSRLAKTARSVIAKGSPRDLLEEVRRVLPEPSLAGATLAPPEKVPE